MPLPCSSPKQVSTKILVSTSFASDYARHVLQTRELLDLPFVNTQQAAEQPNTHLLFLSTMALCHGVGRYRPTIRSPFESDDVYLMPMVV